MFFSYIYTLIHFCGVISVCVVLTVSFPRLACQDMGSFKAEILPYIVSRQFQQQGKYTVIFVSYFQGILYSISSQPYTAKKTYHIIIIVRETSLGLVYLLQLSIEC